MNIISVAIGFAVVVTVFAGLSCITFIFLSIDLHRDIKLRKRS